MEPLNCVLEVTPDGAELWSGSQLQTVDQFVIAQILGLKQEQVKIHTLLAGGSFGRRGNPMADWVVEAAEIAKAIKGRAPVHLVWTRDDDIKGGFYRPLVLHRVKVGLDSTGQISGWQHRVVSQSLFLGTPFEECLAVNGVNTTIEGIVVTFFCRRIGHRCTQRKVSRAGFVVALRRSQSHRLRDGDNDGRDLARYRKRSGGTSPGTALQATARRCGRPPAAEKGGWN